VRRQQCKWHQCLRFFIDCLFAVRGSRYAANETDKHAWQVSDSRLVEKGSGRKCYYRNADARDWNSRIAS